MPAEKSYVFKREESRSFDQDVQFTRLGSSRCLLFCFVLFRGGGGGGGCVCIVFRDKSIFKKTLH